ncbi:COG3385: FOG: Transposase and inactivated derivatives [hydrothermal vent metagenome]|uniref:COG3385: FOG: Transposase and inactivated derivatives n=1 Tax=hydrothermal vent metagenome TaxID=652676 RepID=A0A3B0V0P8_9ZZZZ
MTEILALLQIINQSVLDATTRRRLAIIILAMLAMAGHITMRGISRWTEEGGSYRTIQRLFNMKIDWSQLMVTFVAIWFADVEDIFLLVGDETVVTKAGKQTHGLDRFFSSIFGRPVKGLAFLAFSLVSVKRREAYPIRMEQLSKEKALCGKRKKQGAKRKYGSKLDDNQIPDAYLVSTETVDKIRTHIYQMQMWHKLFPDKLNIVIVRKVNLENGKRAHVVLFSSDLTLAADKLVDYYRLRFQIEFNFRDAKQFWGLEDFMNVKQQPVHNFANLSMFMVTVAQQLMQQRRDAIPNFGVNDLKAEFPGRKYVSELLKLLPETLNELLFDGFFAKVGVLGRINAPLPP